MIGRKRFAFLEIGTVEVFSFKPIAQVLHKRGLERGLIFFYFVDSLLLYLISEFVDLVDHREILWSIRLLERILFELVSFIKS